MSNIEKFITYISSPLVLSSHLFDLVQQAEKPGELNMMFRVAPGEQDPEVFRDKEKTWHGIQEKVLRSLDPKSGDRAHLCKANFLKNGQYVYGWCISLYSKDMEQTILRIGRSFGFASAEDRRDHELGAPPGDPLTTPTEDNVKLAGPHLNGALPGREAPVRVGDSPVNERGRMPSELPVPGRAIGFNPETGRGVQAVGTRDSYHPMKARRSAQRR